MRVLQLIDTLRPGGAERMAVSYANALVKRVEHSYLCCTREEGLLKRSLKPEVEYLFLRKRSTLDLGAFWRLRKFIRQNRIDLIQAHSSSWFLGLFIKLSSGRVKLVWHDHYGKDLMKRDVTLLKAASGKFDAIISVNSELERWAKNRLNTRRVHYLPNFVIDEKKVSFLERPTKEKKEKYFNIICVANLRPQKDHLNLLRAFNELQKLYPVRLHLIGKDENNSYSERIKIFINENNLKENVFLYGEQSVISPFLDNADIGVLSSTSEGLPVALLEYGKAGLAVVCTDVGQCKEVLDGCGRLVPPNDPNALAANLIYYLDHPKEREKDANVFQQRIVSNYTEELVIEKALDLFYGINIKSD